MLNGCSFVRKTDPYVQGLFKLTGFSDNNRNGVIDKPALLNLWSAKEGYLENADLDGEEGISVLEAKYYLLTLKNISPKEKAEYSLTSEEKVTLGNIFFKKADEILNSPERKYYIGPVDRSIAHEKGSKLLELLDQAVLADLDKELLALIFKNALRAAQELKNNTNGTKRFIEGFAEKILAAKLEKDKVKELILLVLDIKDPYLIDGSIDSLLSCAVKSDLSETDLREIFKKVASIKNPEAIFETFLELNWYKDALDIARASSYLNHRINLLSEIAYDMAMKKQKTKAWNIFQEAFVACGADEAKKCGIAKDMASAGFFTQALKIIDNLTNVEEQDSGYFDVSTTFAHYGYLETASQLINKINDSRKKDEALVCLAKKYVENKKLPQVLNCLRSITDMYIRAKTNIDIISMLYSQENRQNIFSLMCEALEISCKVKHASPRSKFGEYDSRVDLLRDLLYCIRWSHCVLKYSDKESVILFKKALAIANVIGVYEAMILPSYSYSPIVRSEKTEKIFSMASKFEAINLSNNFTNIPPIKYIRYADDKTYALINVVENIAEADISLTAKKELRQEAIKVSATLAGFESWGSDCQEKTMEVINRLLPE
ncbi:MAG: hypothetical protein KKA19_05680 [Candidatus Margulisbacteria bacterium]|nr:hypothetical protein [Candidatus Margulisiibacteriota bacterium]